MSVTINTKPKETPKLDPDELSNEEIVDDIVRATEEINKIKAKMKPFEAQIAEHNNIIREHEKELVQRADMTVGAKDSVSFEGTKGFLIEIGKRAMKRTITDKAKILEFLGAEAFVEACTIPLKVIDNYLTKPQRDEVCEEDHNGKRSVKLKKIGE